MIPLTGDTYMIDTNTVRILLINFIVWNKTIEENVQYLLRTNDSSIYVMALKVQYEGFGVHSKDITKAVDINRYSLIFR